MKIKNKISRTLKKMGLMESGQGKENGRFQFYEVGFHGDRYLIELVDFLVGQVDYFVETGTNVGTTLSFIARRHPELTCLSCEPDPKAFAEAARHTEGLTNVTIFNELSQTFIKRIEEQYAYLFDENVLFWLDAHGWGFEWPLKDELRFITTRFKKGLILIDDFKVPGRNQFGYDHYMDQICSYEYVKDALDGNFEYELYYPTYADRTSKHHPLQGWGLIRFGDERTLEFPDPTAGRIERVEA